ncbi:MAG: extracellular solute-binding protein [Anaerolineae bacterium]
MRTDSLRRLTRLLLPLLLGGLCAFALGCQSTLPGLQLPSSPTQPAPGATSSAATATPTAASPQASPPPPQTGDRDNEQALDPQTRPITLTLWTIERFSPQAEGEPGQIMATGLKVFANTYPHLNIEVLLKKPYGQGGILDFLRTAKEVAPSVLPDLVFIDIAELPPAWRAELLQSLDGRLDRNVVGDLHPAAQNVGSVDGHLVGVPFEMGLSHLVYNTSKVASPPLLWTDVLSQNVRYAFPAKSQNGQVNDALLAQYLAAGARLQDDEGAPIIDEPALRALLEFYAAAVEAEIIDASLLEAAQTDDLWPVYLNAEVGLVNASAHRYLADRGRLSSSSVSSLPTRNGVPVNIARGWAMAIVTDDPARQVEALRFIEWFTAPDRLATWNRSVGYIPTRISALAMMDDGDPYWAFVEEQLNFVQPRPSFAGYDLLARILHEAIAAVISGEATPEEALVIATGALNP